MGALGIFGDLTKLKSSANDLPYTSQVALGLFGQCNAQASKVAQKTNQKTPLSFGGWRAEDFGRSVCVFVAICRLRFGSLPDRLQAKLRRVLVSSAELG